MHDLLRISDLTTSSAILISTPEGPISLSVDDVQKWICPEAPRHQCLRFLLICRDTGINPFEGEAYLFKWGEKWVVAFDKSGWLHRAENHPQYDGYQSGIIIRKLDPKDGPVGDPIEVEGTFLLVGKEVVVGGWAKVYRKDRRYPTVSKVSMAEYRKDSPTWKGITCTMINKIAMVQALRHSGVVFAWKGYDSAEVPPKRPLRRDPGPLPIEPQAEYQATPMPSLSPDLMVDIQACIEQLGMSPYFVQVMLSKRGASNLAELTDVQGQDILTKLRQKIDETTMGETLLPDKEPDVVVDGEVVNDLPEEEKVRLLAKAISAGEIDPETLVGEDLRRWLSLPDSEDETPVLVVTDNDVISSSEIKDGPAFANTSEKIDEVLANESSLVIEDPDSDIPDVARPETALKKASKRSRRS